MRQPTNPLNFTIFAPPLSATAFFRPKRRRMTFHFIALAGSVMHNLALALLRQGHTVQGSDDVIFGAAAERLAAHGVLPEKEGWFPEKITTSIDAVILGMHARPDNPELLRAKELGLRIYSFPEFLAQHAAHKQRIAIAGSHGKTTVTAMLMHAFRHANYNFDYAVGASVPGFEHSVALTESAPVMLMEGDEYPTSAEDLVPKAQRLKPHMLVLTGIAWDHANIYENEAEYQKAFEDILGTLPKAGTLIANKKDKTVRKLAEALQKERDDVQVFFYSALKYKVRDGKYFIKHGKQEYALQFFGAHNIENLAAAWEVAQRLGMAPETFFAAMERFTGAGRRLEILQSSATHDVILDFAHAPSKLQASVEAAKERHPKRKLTACVELHTYSSLSKDFIRNYKHTAKAADELLVFINPENFARKKREPFGAEELQEAFAHKNLHFFTDAETLVAKIRSENWENHDLLLMSSGNFGGISPEELTIK